MTSRQLKFRIQTQKKVKRFWAGIVVFVPVVLLWVNQTVSSTKILYQIQKLEEEINHEHGRAVELGMAKDRMTSLESVEWTAKNNLGFVAAHQDDIVVITVPEN